MVVSGQIFWGCLWAVTSSARGGGSSSSGPGRGADDVWEGLGLAALRAVLLGASAGVGSWIAVQ